jgi:hypothetical protein
MGQTMLDARREDPKRRRSGGVRCSDYSAPGFEVTDARRRSRRAAPAATTVAERSHRAGWCAGWAFEPHTLSLGKAGLNAVRPLGVGGKSQV